MELEEDKTGKEEVPYVVVTDSNREELEKLLGIKFSDLSAFSPLQEDN